MAENLPLQVDQAGKRSEDLLKLHKDGKVPGDEPAPDQPQDPTPTDVQKQLADLQAKYDVLNGKYKKEIENADLKQLQRLENENILLKREVSQLQDALKSNEDLVKEVRAELDKNKSQPSAPQAPIDATAILTDEEREHLEAEDLGGKTLEIFLKLARAAGATPVEGQLEQIASKVEEVSKRVENTEQAQHQSAIDTAIPDFKQINADPAFHEWLDKPVSKFSQRKNRDDLQDSLNAGDIEAVKKGVDAFKEETGWGANAQPSDPKPKDPKKGNESPPIEPNESFAGGEQPIQPGKVYTLAEITKFYEDQTKGRWAGREKDAAAIDRDIVLAQQEGRIKA